MVRNDSFTDSLFGKSGEKSNDRSEALDEETNTDFDDLLGNNCDHNEISVNGLWDHSIENMSLNARKSDEEEDVDKLVVLEQFDVKFDHYEKGLEDLTVCMYVRNASRESLVVDFDESSLTVKFQTSDSKFLATHQSSNESTVFKWTLELKYAIKPEECSYRMQSSKVEIYLKKKSPFKWDQVAIVKPKNLNVDRKSSVFTIEGSGSNVLNTSQNLWLQTSGDVQSSPIPPPPPLPITLKTSAVQAERSKEIPRWIPSSISGNSLPHSVGFTGLDNLGNTCFMNSVIQCLSNTEELRDYFMSNHFREDINENNPLGTGGNMAISFAVLLKHLWSGQHYSYSPSKLKSLMGEKISQFSGFAQHDAQEYMAFLLDSLHEDVNRIKNKPYIANMQSQDDEQQLPDEELANDFWRKYRMRNDSVIVDLFQGQYKSKLVCPLCMKVSITFDPFLYLSIPIPKNQILHSVYFFSLDSTKKPIRFLVKLHSDSKVKKLLEIISLRTNVPLSNLQMILVSNGVIQSYFNLENIVPSLPKTGASDMLMIFEMLRKEDVNEDICEFIVQQRLKVPIQNSNKCSYCKRIPEMGKLKRCTQCYRSSYCNQLCQKKDWSEHRKSCLYKPEPVGCPFLITLPQSKCTIKAINELSLDYSRHSVDVFNPNTKSSLNSSENGDDKEDLNSEDELTENPKPKFVLRNNLRNVVADSDDVSPEEFFGEEMPEKSYLVMEWLNTDKESVIVESKDLDHSYDILEAERVHNEKLEVTLNECLQMFTEPEILSPQEAWYCPRCKEHREASKQLSLWRLPQILVIQLKRFSFKSLLFRDKIDKQITFPINGLDLSQFCCSNRLIQEMPVYDLYAIINHYGGMFGGHYTACAKTAFEGQQLGWRLFDDSRVEEIDEDSIVTRNAYILFYRLREEANSSF